MKPDFVTSLMALIERSASINDETKRKIEEDIRDHWGGKKVTIASKAPLTNEQIDERLRCRMPVREIAREFGTCRSTIYRRLGVKARGKKPEP